MEVKSTNEDRVQGTHKSLELYHECMFKFRGLSYRSFSGVILFTKSNSDNEQETLVFGQHSDIKFLFLR